MMPVRFCEECGAELEANAKFCEKCGSPVKAAAVTPPDTPQPVPPNNPRVFQTQQRPLEPQMPVRQFQPVPTYSTMPPEPQPDERKSSASKFIIIGIVGLLVLCGLLVVVLGLGYFSTNTGTIHIALWNTPVPEAIQPQMNPTVSPTNTAIPTEIPRPGVSEYLSRIGPLLNTYVSEFEKFGTLFDQASVEKFPDMTWRNDTYSAFDRVITAAGDVANEPSPVEYDTFKLNFSKAYEEFKAAKPFLHDGIDNVNVDALNSFSAHLQKANEYMDAANAAMP